MSLPSINPNALTRIPQNNRAVSASTKQAAPTPYFQDESSIYSRTVDRTLQQAGIFNFVDAKGLPSQKHSALAMSDFMADLLKLVHSQGANNIVERDNRSNYERRNWSHEISTRIRSIADQLASPVRAKNGMMQKLQTDFKSLVGDINIAGNPSALNHFLFAFSQNIKGPNSIGNVIDVYV